MVARVPEGAAVGELVVENGEQVLARLRTATSAVQIADSLAPGGQPGDRPSRATSTPPSAARAGRRRRSRSTRSTCNYNIRPFLTDIMNATGLAFDRDGLLYISSRHDGIVYQVTPAGAMSVYAEGMGVATGMAFDAGGQPVRRRPRGHHLQDRAGPADLRFRHARALHRGLSPGVRSRRLPLRDRADHVELRFGLPRIARRRGRGLLSRPGPPAGPGIRRRGPAVRGGIPARAQGRRAHRPRRQGRVVRSPGPTSSGWPSRRRALCCLATNTALYRAGRRDRGTAADLDERRDHRRRLGDAHLRAARHQLAVSHRPAQRAGRRSGVQVRGRRRSRAAERRRAPGRRPRRDRDNHRRLGAHRG